MIRVTFNRDGTFRSVQFPDSDTYVPSSPEVQGIMEWLRLHDMDPAVVPLGAEIFYDATFDEWRIPTWPRPIRVCPLCRDVHKVIVRRRARDEKWLPMVATAPYPCRRGCETSYPSTALRDAHEADPHAQDVTTSGSKS